MGWIRSSRGAPTSFNRETPLHRAAAFGDLEANQLLGYGKYSVGGS